MPKKNLPRRAFLKSASITGVTAAASEFARASGAPAPGKWDKEADVVVVGAGAVGLPAAIEAIERRKYPTGRWDQGTAAVRNRGFARDPFLGPD